MAEQAAPAKTLKVISEEEVARHSSETDAWVVIHNLVLDLSKGGDGKFLEEHPGGPDVVLAYAGKPDITVDYEDIGHSASSREWGNKFIIGVKDGGSEEEMARTMIPAAGSVIVSSNGSGSGGLNVPLVIAILVAVISGLIYMLTKQGGKA